MCVSTILIVKACSSHHKPYFQKESNILNFPGVLIRTSTERPEVLDKGTVVVGGITKESVYQSIEMAISMKTEEYLRAVDYKDENVSKKVVKIIHTASN